MHDSVGLRARLLALSHVSRAEAIKKFAIVSGEFTEAGGQLTPTLKVRRSVVTEQYAAQIAALYDEGRHSLTRVEQRAEGRMP